MTNTMTEQIHRRENSQLKPQKSEIAWNSDINVKIKVFKF